VGVRSQEGMSPTGSVETLTGLPPIHLHVCKLVERSHALGFSHAFWKLVNGNHKYSMKSLPHHTKTKICSPIVEAWANLYLSSSDLNLTHPLARPGYHPCNTLPSRYSFDLSPPLPHEKDKQAEFIAAQTVHLNAVL
jgi:hypothetical protein